MDVKCDYCGEPAELIDSAYVYSKSYGNIWMCKPCDAYVGVHKNSGNKPLGRLADKNLRNWKQRAHTAFDPLWKEKMERDGWTKTPARSAGYKWLSKELGIEPEKCHIGMFDIDMCIRTVNLCNPYNVRLAARREG